MISFPTEELKKLIKEKKWDRVEKALKDWSSQELGGADLLALSAVYAEMKTEMNLNYIEKLKQLTQMVKQLAPVGEQINTTAKTANVKKKIKDL